MGHWEQSVSLDYSRGTLTTCTGNPWRWEERIELSTGEESIKQIEWELIFDCWMNEFLENSGRF